ncbi:MAG TPA: alpha/beta hydrolase [Candidatus Ozemobacteraceae bacterium]|nr:alpha/beta hydrolase [Candidatus Ozemobacteraceae bacterium]
MSYTCRMNPPGTSHGGDVLWRSMNLKLGAAVIPLLIAQVPDPDVREPLPARVILVAHGLGVSKEVQRPELEKLARSGFTAVGIDAPHHGERRDEQLDAQSAATGAEAHKRFIAMVAEAAAEIPLLIEYFKTTLHARVAMTGISMGGYTTFASFMHDPRPDAAVPFLASPDWRSDPSSGTLGPDTPAGPVSRPERFSPVPLLVITAGLDTTVPPATATCFVRSLRRSYARTPERLAQIEYPRSEHMMRGDDWNDAWNRAIEFLNLHL